MILLDTNVLGRMTDSADPQCAAARHSVQVLLAEHERLVVAPQVLYEFWVVATRRAGSPPHGQNGLGMTPEQASQWLEFFQRRFTLLPDREELFPCWHALVRGLGITGIRSYDARLVAAMQTYGIERLLTFNVEHFRRFLITIIDPASFEAAGE
jgi:predicted nucleic acid-binding protein